MEAVRQYLVQWIQERVRNAGAVGTVLGMSGGIDSAVVSVLCHQAFGKNALCIALPINSLNQDMIDAELVASQFGLEYEVLDLKAPYEALFNQLPAQLGDERARSLAVANLKPRLRMITLYYYANMLNRLVVGTTNRAELTVGYFTKHGDGGSDILPLGGLVKSQVRALARHLGIPEQVVSKAPSAGLWPGQTDEAELGLRYDDIDRYLTGGQVDPSIAKSIETKRVRSQHKLEPAPIADPFKLLGDS